MGATACDQPITQAVGRLGACAAVVHLRVADPACFALLQRRRPTQASGRSKMDMEETQVPWGRVAGRGLGEVGAGCGRLRGLK